MDVAFDVPIPVKPPCLSDTPDCRLQRRDECIVHYGKAGRLTPWREGEKLLSSSSKKERD